MPEQKGREFNSYHTPSTVEELTEQNVRLIAELDAAARSSRTPTDRVVDRITGFCGRIQFVWLHVLWFGTWILINSLPHLPLRLRRLHFDPYPYPLLLMIISLEAIFLTTFILISQNRQSKLAERRNHLDLQINLLSEQENTKILAMLHSVVEHLGIPDGDPDVDVLEKSTRPDRLVKQIQDVIESEGS